MISQIERQPMEPNKSDTCDSYTARRYAKSSHVFKKVCNKFKNLLINERIKLTLWSEENANYKLYFYTLDKNNKVIKLKNCPYCKGTLICETNNIIHEINRKRELVTTD